MEKIKVILVDDEISSRNTIKSYLENVQNYEIIADFSNGKTAIDWLRKNKVDIMLCDMQMPEINGVELIRNVHIIDEYLPVIAISGYDDFNYVRGSLINGAANYLLKHELSKEKLIQALEQVREKYRITPAENRIYQKKGYSIYDDAELSTEKISELAESGQIDFDSKNIIPIVISPDYKMHYEFNIAEYKKDICKAILDMIAQILSEKYQYITCITKRDHIILLMSFGDERSMLSMLNQQSNLVGRLQRQIIRMLDITVTVVTGDIHTELDSTIREAKKMELLSADKLYLGGNKIICYAVTTPIVYYEGNLPGNLWEQFIFEITKQMDHSLNTAQEILQYMEERRFAWERVFYICNEILTLFQRQGMLEQTEMQNAQRQMKEFEEYEQFRSLILDMLYKKIQGTKNNRKKQHSALVEQVIEYIQQNIAEDISLEICAEIVGSSYTYLSKEFKKETGMRFVEYLNQQRVNKAKSLLLRKDIPMKQIVEMSGFRNYNYFFKVFKEAEGMTPSEFMSKK